MAAHGKPWAAMRALECQVCDRGRERRARLIETDDPRLRTARFAVAPYLRKNNEPKFHAMLLRAAEQGKALRESMLWFAAADKPEIPAQVAKSPND